MLITTTSIMECSKNCKNRKSSSQPPYDRSSARSDRSASTSIFLESLATIGFYVWKGRHIFSSCRRTRGAKHGMARRRSRGCEINDRPEGYTVDLQSAAPFPRQDTDQPWQVVCWIKLSEHEIFSCEVVGPSFSHPKWTRTSWWRSVLSTRSIRYGRRTRPSCTTWS